ncbi:MAG: carboxypeptidase M32, partial [Caldilineaceae bacterium]|nr:carboxypeptidase M32 [Caldilineaceae bacterium]
MDAQLQDLKDRLAVVRDLHAAVALMNWDQDTNMPAGGAQGRAQQMSTLSRLSHEHFVDPAMGKLIDDLEPWAA